MLRIESANDAVVVGKRKRRIRGKHSFRRTRPIGREREQMLSVITLGIVVSESVERNQNQVRFRKLLRGVRSVINRDDRSDSLGLAKGGQARRHEQQRENAIGKASPPMAHQFLR